MRNGPITASGRDNLSRCSQSRLPTTAISDLSEPSLIRRCLRCPHCRDEPTPYATVGLALQAVRDGDVAAALVPIENSVEGGVSATLDNLAYGEPLRIIREVVLPVQFTLFARNGTQLHDVRRVLTHPHAAAQCRDWLARHLADALITEGGSTAAAAAEVADPRSRFDAAICADIAGELNRLVPLATRIADNPDAVTRFVLVARPGSVGPANRR